MKTLIKKAPLSFLLFTTALLGALLALTGARGALKDLDYDLYREPGAALVFRGLSEGISPWGPLPEAGEDRALTAMEDTAQEDTAEEAETEDRAAEEEAPAKEAPEQEAPAEEEETEEPLPEGPFEIPEGVCSEVFPAVDYGNAKSRYLSPEGTVYEAATEGIFAPTGEFYYLQPVSEEYFDDVLFIGDSRTDGLFYWGDLEEHSDFFARNSLSVFTALKKKILFHSATDGDSKMKLEEVLEAKQYGKIYVSLGVNELGVSNIPKYYDTYKELLARIRELQPEALIYIQGIMHVTKKTAQSSPFTNNTNIVERNQAISTFANGRDIFYLDMNELICDEEGNLRSDLSGDGVHLKASAYSIWRDYLLQNAIVKEAEAPSAQ